MTFNLWFQVDCVKMQQGEVVLFSELFHRLDIVLGDYIRAKKREGQIETPHVKTVEIIFRPIKRKPQENGKLMIELLTWWFHIKYIVSGTIGTSFTVYVNRR